MSPISSHSNDSLKSLLSLSAAAASAMPIPVAKMQTNSDSFAEVGGSLGYGNPGRQHHRRLSSTSQVKRRQNDARDAVARPSPASLPLSSLSLSSPSPPASISLSSTSVGSANDNPEIAGLANPVIIPKNGKKRGVDHKCESCSKVYRHPSCLIKHRWEHTPHWRESSKYVLSKHQQVQLLEAAAILSHLSPTSASLPEDRSLWPSFLSGGTPRKAEVPIASSVPTQGGPRMHDYHLPASSAATQVRPGLLAVPIPEPEDESEEDDYMMVDDNAYRGGGFGARSKPVKQEEEEWDGLDMDMD